MSNDLATAFSTPLSATSERWRYDRLDAVRGAAVVWMAVFHFCFDLNYMGLWKPRQFFLSDPFWSWQRAAIVTLFLFCAGLSLAVALHQGQSWPRFWKRWAQVVGCAALVSAGSTLLFPGSWIYFGVLHALAVMLLLARCLAIQGRASDALLVGLALVALVLPQVLRMQALEASSVSWLGLGTRAPRTEDWVPLLPWLGVVLLGLVAGRALLRRGGGWLAGPLPAPLWPLSTLGCWSLSFYMVHQPVLLGVLMGGRKLAWW